MNSQETVIALMAEVHRVREHDRNTSRDLRWKRLDTIQDEVGRALRKTGGFIAQEVLSVEYSTFPARNGGSRTRVTAIVRFKVFGTEGEPVTGDVCAEASDAGDKATGKMMLTAVRTFLQQLLLLPTDRADPNSSTYELA